MNNRYSFSVPDEKRTRVIIDTDVRNEADDAFAVVHAMLSPKLDIAGFVAAHFGKDGSMEESYNELKKISEMIGFDEKLIFEGATQALKSGKTSSISRGAQLIIEEASKISDKKVYVLFLGPLTDLAEAYLSNPKIAKNIVAIWIGGGQYPDGGPEFNLQNDILAANIVFNSDIEVWQVPKDVYEMMPVSFAELQYKLTDCGKVGKYLLTQLLDHAQSDKAVKSAFRTGESWVLGDSPAVGLLLYEQRYDFTWTQAPFIGESMAYHFTTRNRPIRVYNSIDSRFILEDLYAKLHLNFSE